MKRKFLIVLFVLGSSLTFGQYRVFHFGFKAAPQIDWLRTSAESYKNDGAKPGFSWGFIGEYAFTQNYHLTSGFNVIFNGGKLSYPYKSESGSEGRMTSDYDFKWLEIPFTLKMRTNPASNFSFFGQIGLGTAFRLQAKVKNAFSSGAESRNYDKTTFKDISFFRESLLVGGGVEYKFERSVSIGAQLLFNNGLSDILTGKNNLSGTEHHGIPNSFEINTFILF